MKSQTFIIEQIEKKSLNPNRKYILASNYIVRNDIKRNILFTQDEVTRETTHPILINTFQAITISLFDGERSLCDIIDYCSDLFEIKEEDAINLIYNCLDVVSEGISENVNNEKRDFKRNEFIIDTTDLDLKRIRLYRPLFLTLHIAETCFRDCRYCYDERRVLSRKEILTTNEIFKILNEAAEMGIIKVDIAGGEPFIRDDIPEIVRKIYNLGMSI